MALQRVQDFTFLKTACQVFLCENAGDELPLHDHTFNHLTVAMVGEIECFNEVGKSIKCKPCDAPVEYVAGRVHGIRGLTAGAMFMNIFPIID